MNKKAADTFRKQDPEDVPYWNDRVITPEQHQRTEYQEHREEINNLRHEMMMQND